MESELFGHEKGSFTGAQQAHKGKFEVAHGGTLFLDEIADMSALAQVKILRAVEYGDFERVGGERLQRSDARIISATNCPLAERIACREVPRGSLPPARRVGPANPGFARAPGRPALAHRHGIAKRGRGGARRHITSIHPAAMEMLLSYPWPGNLRELHHKMRSVVLFCEGAVVLPEHVVFQRDTTVRATHVTPASNGAPPERDGRLRSAARAARHRAR